MFSNNRQRGTNIMRDVSYLGDRLFANKRDPAKRRKNNQWASSSRSGSRGIGAIEFILSLPPMILLLIVGADAALLELARSRIVSCVASGLNHPAMPVTSQSIDDHVQQVGEHIIRQLCSDMNVGCGGREPSSRGRFALRVSVAEIEIDPGNGAIIGYHPRYFSSGAIHTIQWGVQDKVLERLEDEIQRQTAPLVSLVPCPLARPATQSGARANARYMTSSYIIIVQAAVNRPHLGGFFSPNEWIQYSSLGFLRINPPDSMRW